MPTYPIDGGGAEVSVDCQSGLGKAPVALNIQVRNIHGLLNINSGGFGGRLHWAVYGPNGEWSAPTLQPDGSAECDGVASTAGLNKDGFVRMSFKPGHVPERIVFVVVIQCQGQTHWLKTSGGKDFVVDVQALAAEAGGGNPCGGADSPGGEAGPGGARVAERPKEWAALLDAKAKAESENADKTGKDFAPKPRRRAKTAAPKTPKAGLEPAVKTGQTSIEGELGDVAWTVVRTTDNVSVFVELSMELVEQASVFLHWGCAEQAGSEWEKCSEVVPGAKAFDAVACRSEVEGQARTELRFKTAQAPQWVSFVLFVKMATNEMWIKSEHGDNFWIDVLASKDSVANKVSSGKETAGERFCAAETKYANWTQFNRICMATDVLSAKEGLGIQEAAWVASDLCLADAKVLEWYRNSGYQPKDMAFAQERIGNIMASAHSSATDSTIRTLMRLCVRSVPRGSSSGGDAIRHGILNIMRTHGIKEGHRPGIECKFIEQWHQKLHTNSAPDDIAICSGYLAFLASGNPDDMWRVIWEEGKLTREDLGKMCATGFADHTKSGAKGLNFVPRHLPHMYNDVNNFLGLLKHVHGGSDLFTLCEACKGQYPDHGAECLAFEIYHGRDDPMVLGKILDMRRRLEPCLGKRDILMLDVALEDLSRALGERAQTAQMSRDDLLNFLIILLEDLLLSRRNASLSQGVELLMRLVRGDRGKLEAWSPEWCKMVHAACDRIALTCAANADKIAELLQDCADKLNDAGKRPGAVFQPNSASLATFGEEKARCLTERVVAQALKPLMPMLRRGAGLGAWEVVSQGQGGQALGTVEVMAALPVELAEGKAPVVAVVETMTGWEDIPAGIVALLLPAGQAVDTLSHVAIRARNQQVLLASCDDDNILKELQAAKGKRLRVEITAGGVSWSAASESSTSAATSAVAAPKAVMQKIAPPPEPPAVVIPSADFVKNKKSLGGKSLHLAELKPEKGTYNVPVSATVPYRSFEKALQEPANEGIKEELDEILATGDFSEARALIIEELAVPTEIETELGKALAAAGGPPLSGDWQRALKGVWASKWTDRAVSSRKQMNVPDDVLFLAALVQPVVPAAYAFVIHTQSPLPGAKKGEQLVELCVGLGESLVSNSPGRALSATVGPKDQPVVVHVYPSKPEGVFTPDAGTLIFRSDSNGEDLEGFAGAGLYDSVTVTSCIHRPISYVEEPLFFDSNFREQLLRRLYELGSLVEANFGGAPQDIEGAVHKDGSLVVTQSRPQV
eukprot:TRINITY_DN1761_c0_g1_i1.p1 TRINITY_DN1761_c0_g1~~TRINITY_DN1761_c0_g1_i1.p1  ORF type:complete len:1254 (+),score=201.47 TRINITY_DN1761_c0_g1_i1:89-3850(+)